MQYKSIHFVYLDSKGNPFIIATKVWGTSEPKTTSNKMDRWHERMDESARPEQMSEFARSLWTTLAGRCWWSRKRWNNLDAYFSQILMTHIPTTLSQVINLDDVSMPNHFLWCDAPRGFQTKHFEAEADVIGASLTHNITAPEWIIIFTVPYTGYYIRFMLKRLFHLLRQSPFHYNSRRVFSGDAATSWANRKSSDNSLSSCNYPTLRVVRAQFRHTRVTDISTPYNSFPVP